MTKYLQRENNKITIAVFWENYLLKRYNFDPPYQRRSVWTDEKKSFFIDTILKNFPMPPIFLHQKIDDETGRTTYDVIDGKQRLTAIIEFIKNEIPAADESDNPFYEEAIAGKYFDDFNAEELSEHKKRFWRYVIPIEYVDTTDQAIIDNIFDRLNRNGEPLEGQELRNASYYNSPLLAFVARKSRDPFWRERLKVVDVSRMEDTEFVSEITFALLANSELHANQEELDKLYDKYTNNETVNWDDVGTKFDEITTFIKDLELDYEAWRITGVSHLYGLWCSSMRFIENGISADQVRSKVHSFYKLLRSHKFENEYVNKYKMSMSARTKDKGQRKRRTEAILEFCR